MDFTGQSNLKGNHKKGGTHPQVSILSRKDSTKTIFIYYCHDLMKSCVKPKRITQQLPLSERSVGLTH